MKRRAFLAGAGAAPAASVSVGGQAGKPPARQFPNILFVLFDKCRTDAIGAYGERKVHTPNIDALAAGGIRFANCYTPQSLCAPARASILTGSYPHAHGLQRNPYEYAVDPSHTNFPDRIPDPFRDPRFRLWDNFVVFLNNAGYATAHIGKWHLGSGNPGFFDYFKGFNSLLVHWIGEPHRSAYRPDVQTEQGIRFIEEHAREPFFLYQSYYPPHEPMDPPKRFLEHYPGQEHAAYYGTVSNLDWNVGRLVEALRRNGILDDTLIIVTSDHAKAWGPRPGSYPGGMCTAYDEASRIPLILRYPRLLPQGAVWRSGVSLVDLMPTILSVAGIKPVMGYIPRPDRPLLQGRDLLPEIQAGRDQWASPIVMQNIPLRAIDGTFYDERAVRLERYKLILRKYHAGAEFRPGELYDMQADPGETRNLYEVAAHRSAVASLAATLRTWGRQYRDDLAEQLGEWAEKH